MECILYEFRNKQKFFPYATLKYRSFTAEVESVYSAVRAVYLHNIDSVLGEI